MLQSENASRFISLFCLGESDPLVGEVELCIKLAHKHIPQDSVTAEPLAVEAQQTSGTAVFLLQHSP